MSVQPCRNAEADILRHRKAFHDLESGIEPESVFVRWGSSKDFQGFIDLIAASAGHPCAQMSGLHCTWTSSAHHQTASFRQLLADHHYLTVAFVTSRKSMSSHDADDTFLIK